MKVNRLKNITQLLYYIRTWSKWHKPLAISNLIYERICCCWYQTCEWMNESPAPVLYRVQHCWYKTKHNTQKQFQNGIFSIRCTKLKKIFYLSFRQILKGWFEITLNLYIFLTHVANNTRTFVHDYESRNESRFRFVVYQM